MLNDNKNEENVDEHILGLPYEMWEKILKLKRMEVRDIVNFRLVNKNCKYLAENLFNRWTITLNDSYEHDETMGPYLENLLDLQIEKLTVKHLSTPLPYRSPGVILRHPDLLKVLRIKHRHFMDHSISAENLHILLKSRNLEVLELGLGNANLNSLLYSSQPPLIGYDFSKLKSMTIDIHYAENIPFNLLHRILKGSIFSNLHSLDITFNNHGRTAYQISCDVLEFIIKYRQTLKYVKFQLSGGSDGPEFLEPADVPDLQKCSKLESLIVLTDLLHSNWISLLEFQTQLAHLVFDENCIPMRVFRTVLVKNYNTLISIELHHLEADTVVVDGAEVYRFDFAIFSNCQNLKKLSLTMSNGDENDVAPESRNLLMLSQNLESLKLDIRLPSEDLLVFSSTRMQLKNLSLRKCGYSDGFGINGSVLENFLLLPELIKILMGKESINRSIAAEAIKLENIFETMGCDINLYSNICLKRKPDSSLWRQICSYL